MRRRHVVALVACAALPACSAALLTGEREAPVAATPSAPPPPRTAYLDHTSDELDSYVACATQGYTAVGAPREVPLAEFAPPEFRFDAGHCYTAVVLFGPDARLSPHAQAGMSFVYRDRSKSSEVRAGPGLWGAGGIAARGCVETPSVESFYVEATWGSAVDRTHVDDLGTGTASVQLFARRIDPARQAPCARDRAACLADFRAGATRAECEGRYAGCIDTIPGRPSDVSCRR